MIWPKHPKILEVNTWPWLKSLSEIYNESITLKNVPEEIIDKEFIDFDVIWLMGVWERSPRAREIAVEDPTLQKEYHIALKSFSREDIVGSPYSIHYYHVDTHLGGNEGLSFFRKQLIKHNLFLLLDFVPNHVAVDHIWTLEKSEIFIKGTPDDLKIHPNEYFSVNDHVYAHGKDPNFPSWTDTIQINAFSPQARQKAISTLINIANYCDGVRCDMAMLMINKIFASTWGRKAGHLPKEEFWIEIINRVREKYPNFKFLAEVYWNMEWELQQQGFDYCYDKKLYDRLIYDNAQSVRAHLKADWDFQSKLVRFIENHDEESAINKFGEEKSKAAAIITFTLPGARLATEVQLFGYKIKLPIQLGRRLIEEKNLQVTKFYQCLLKAAPGRTFDKSKWTLCRVDQINDFNHSNINLIAYQWRSNEQCLLIVINYSPNPSQGHVRIAGINYRNNNWNFIDLLAQKTYTYEGENLSRYGLYIDLSPWKGHIFDIKRLKT